MKNIIKILVLFSAITAQAQIANKKYNQDKDQKFYNNENEIVATETTINIISKVIYNAIPDGYHITYTTSFIGHSIKETENKMNKKMDSLTKKVLELKLSRKDIVTDIVALDPIFDFYRNDSIPNGYKLNQNITFNIKSINDIGALSKVCLDFGIYDLINAQAYVNNSKPIFDSIGNKMVEVLNRKKKLCADIGWTFSQGKPTMSEFKDVTYPSERYLKSIVRNATLFKHHIDQNSTLNMERTVDVDNYFDLNLKNADFVFNGDLTGPVVQFYAQLNYGFIKKDTEAEMREKIKKEEEDKVKKSFYIIDKNGSLKKVDVQ